ncbi:MAG: acyl-CoA dehydratase activase-related protein [Bacillota bacterium]
MASSLLIGIPQSLKYFGFSRVWESFLAESGFDLVYSGPTTKDVVDKGIECSVSEACLPVKLIHGEVASLEGKVDRVFLPRLVNISGTTVFCPKFLGMPDMVRASLGNKVELLSPRIDLRKGPRDVSRSFLESVRGLGEGGMRAARTRLRDLVASLRIPQDFDAAPVAAAATVADGTPEDGPTIGVLGYPYLVENEYASMGLVRKLAGRGVRVLKVPDVSEADLASVSGEFDKQVFWYFSDRVVKAGYHWCRAGAVDGLIHLTAFGCGPDAIADKLLELEARRSGLPYLTVSVDECSGEAGVVTRVEAFVDMLTRVPGGQRYGGMNHNVESDVSAYGAVSSCSHCANGGNGERSHCAAGTDATDAQPWHQVRP